MKNSPCDRVTNEEVQSYPEIELEYSLSKDEVWEILMRRIEGSQSGSRKIDSRKLVYRIAMAASFLLLVSFAGFLRFYSKTVSATAGQHLTVCLPDSSVIELNAQSTVNYYPYWFPISRIVTLDGEAFFKVNRGSQFKVVSEQGKTTVLGTSFNIYARNNEYNVTCFTGKVKVETSDKSERILLNANEQASINKEGDLQLIPKVNTEAVKAWRNNMFVFTGSSVLSVLQEIERQYNIKIDFRADPNLTYTGNFSKSLSKKEVLDLVCKPLGFKFEAKSELEFLVN